MCDVDGGVRAADWWGWRLRRVNDLQQSPFAACLGDESGGLQSVPLQIAPLMVCLLLPHCSWVRDARSAKTRLEPSAWQDRLQSVGGVVLQQREREARCRPGVWGWLCQQAVELG
mmetsp:Transcript_8074/g.19853  ORF Transcript_8074/g.19853 Transcript_8074/m.19853 type:complete len:115 (+) Transcript_8074:802-1146(+)